MRLLLLNQSLSPARRRITNDSLGGPWRPAVRYETAISLWSITSEDTPNWDNR